MTTSRVSILKPPSAADANYIESLGGVRAVPCQSLPDLFCPFCASRDICFLMGEISFAATISGDDLCDGAQPLAAAICSRSHVFFLCEKDVFRTVSKLETTADWMNQPRRANQIQGRE
jgi:hypothetical protein